MKPIRSGSLDGSGDCGGGDRCAMGQDPDDEAPVNLLMLPDQRTSETTSSDTSHTFYERNGPFIVNSDGTLSRIKNWAQMSDIEKERAKRLIAKRNKSRMDTIKENQERPLDEDESEFQCNTDYHPLDPEK